MKIHETTFVILVAEDDKEDRMLIKDALEENPIVIDLRFVGNGDELLFYLLSNDKVKHPNPELILLDLNMPKMDGREALKEIKKHPELRYLPIVILTTSDIGDDVLQTYDLGVSSFITKPVTFTALVEIMQILSKYWFDVVLLPNTVAYRY
jgi:CheY-like chemotaxis protein